MYFGIFIDLSKTYLHNKEGQMQTTYGTQIIVHHKAQIYQKYWKGSTPFSIAKLDKPSILA